MKDTHNQAWHDARRLVLGGSDANKIMAGEWRGLWAVKTGRSTGEDLSDVLAVHMGTYTEPFNKIWFTDQTGIDVSTERCDHLRHSALDYMGANLDGQTPLGDVFEAKHITPSSNIQKAQERYWFQLQHCMEVHGADVAYLSCFFGNSKWDYAVVDREPKSLKVMLAWEAEFWDYVQRDVEPEDRPGYGVKVVVSDLRTVDMTGSNLWANNAREYLDTKHNFDWHVRVKDALKEQVEPDVGEAHGHGIRIKRSTNKSLRIFEEKK